MLFTFKTFPSSIFEIKRKFKVYDSWDIFVVLSILCERIKYSVVNYIRRCDPWIFIINDAHERCLETVTCYIKPKSFLITGLSYILTAVAICCRISNGESRFKQFRRSQDMCIYRMKSKNRKALTLDSVLRRGQQDRWITSPIGLNGSTIWNHPLPITYNLLLLGTTMTWNVSQVRRNAVLI